MNNNFAQLLLEATSAPRFVDFWRSYIGDNTKYIDNINAGGTVSADNVAALMEWKARPRFRAKAGECARAVPASFFNDARVKPPLSDDDLREQYGLIRQYLRAKGPGNRETAHLANLLVPYRTTADNPDIRHQCVASLGTYCRLD